MFRWTKRKGKILLWAWGKAGRCATPADMYYTLSDIKMLSGHGPATREELCRPNNVVKSSRITPNTPF